MITQTLLRAVDDRAVKITLALLVLLAVAVPALNLLTPPGSGRVTRVVGIFWKRSPAASA